MPATATTPRNQRDGTPPTTAPAADLSELQGAEGLKPPASDPVLKTEAERLLFVLKRRTPAIALASAQERVRDAERAFTDAQTADEKRDTFTSLAIAREGLDISKAHQRLFDEEAKAYVAHLNDQREKNAPYLAEALRRYEIAARIEHEMRAQRRREVARIDAVLEDLTNAVERLTVLHRGESGSVSQAPLNRIRERIAKEAV